MQANRSWSIWSKVNKSFTAPATDCFIHPGGGGWIHQALGNIKYIHVPLSYIDFPIFYIYIRNLHAFRCAPAFRFLVNQSQSIGRCAKKDTPSSTKTPYGLITKKDYYRSLVYYKILMVRFLEKIKNTYGCSTLDQKKNIKAHPPYLTSLSPGTRCTHHTLAKINTNTMNHTSTPYTTHTAWSALKYMCSIRGLGGKLVLTNIF